MNKHKKRNTFTRHSPKSSHRGRTRRIQQGRQRRMIEALFDNTRKAIAEKIEGSANDE